MKENLGILLPIASLPGNHGVGDFGPCSYKFISWLKDNNYKYWQVLPLNPIGPGNSPYMSACSEAIEERYIYLNDLHTLGYLDKQDIKNYRKSSDRIDYKKVGKYKDAILFKAFLYFKNKPLRGYKKFKKENNWLIKYALFMCFKEDNNNLSWNTWPKWMITYFDEHKYVPNKYKDRCEFIYFKQFIAYKQYAKLRDYAHKNNITLIADCPFYVGIDSVDCWTHKDEFVMDRNYHPTLVSGCPPDVFSDDGQLWGTPIYDFNKMKQNNYSFLVDRIGFLASTCDMLRLDHFRAFDTYCVIPSEDINARRGKWVEGPKEAFFEALYKKYPNINLIAEDLGDLFPSVLELRDKYNLPGMYIVEFTIFDVNNMSKNRQIVYPGTHDNQTLVGWLNSLPKENIDFLKWKFGENKDLYTEVFNYILSLPSYITIFQLQDLIMLDDRGRINYPGTISDLNWTFKLKDFSWIKKVKFKNI